MKHWWLLQFLLFLLLDGSNWLWRNRISPLKWIDIGWVHRICAMSHLTILFILRQLLWLVIWNVFFIQLNRFFLYLLCIRYSWLLWLIWPVPTIIPLSAVSHVLSGNGLSVSHLGHQLPLLHSEICGGCFGRSRVRLLLFVYLRHICIWFFLWSHLFGLLWLWWGLNNLIWSLDLSSLWSFSMSSCFWWLSDFFWLTVLTHSVLLFKFCNDSFFNVTEMCMLKACQLNELCWPYRLNIAMLSTCRDDGARYQVVIGID